MYRKLGILYFVLRFCRVMRERVGRNGIVLENLRSVGATFGTSAGQTREQKEHDELLRDMNTCIY